MNNQDDLLSMMTIAGALQDHNVSALHRKTGLSRVTLTLVINQTHPPEHFKNSTRVILSNYVRDEVAYLNKLIQAG